MLPAKIITFTQTTLMRFGLLLFLSSFIFVNTNAQKTLAKSSAGINLTLPVISNGRSYDYYQKESFHKTGYWGAGISVFYRKEKNEFALGIVHPSLKKYFFPEKGGNEDLWTDIFEATITHKVSNLFAVIGGINYSLYHYSLYFDMPQFKDIIKRDETMGLTAGAAFLFSRHVSLNATYRPALVSFDQKSYRQILSCALKVQLNFWNKK